MTSGHRGRRSLYGSPHQWHRGDAMNALRALRHAADLSQRDCAALIDVPLNTFRMWDSGIRPTPPHLLQRAALALANHARNTARLSLDQLAREFGVHERTLRAAARTGRLEVTFSSRSAFGRPIRLATRTAVQVFMRRDYRRYNGQSPAMAPLPSIPRDYDARLKRLRRWLRLTQHELARRVGAANKAVVYQWESRQRTPSPVFWQRVEALRATRLGERRAHISSSIQPRDSSRLTPIDGAPAIDSFDELGSTSSHEVRGVQFDGGANARRAPVEGRAVEPVTTPDRHESTRPTHEPPPRMFEVRRV